MDFTIFLGYFIASTVVVELMKIGIRFLIIKRQQKKMQRAFEDKIKGGNVQVMSMEDIVKKLQQAAESQDNSTDGKGKKIWN